MKILSRDFTTKEKVLLLVLVLVLLALVYYQFVDSPVRESLAKAADMKSAREVELVTVQARLQKLEAMQREVDEVNANGTLSPMPSYNNERNVNALLNDVMSGMSDFSITWSNITKEGDQVRRAISFQFVAPDYASVRSVFANLTGSEYRCLVSDVRCSSKENNLSTDNVTVSATITFYETMVGGTVDAGLPQEDKK